MTLSLPKFCPPEIVPVSPGEMLQEAFLTPLCLSQYALAKAIELSPRRIKEIVHGTRAVTADRARRTRLPWTARPELEWHSTDKAAVGTAAIFCATLS